MMYIAVYPVSPKEALECRYLNRPSSHSGFNEYSLDQCVSGLLSPVQFTPLPLDRYEERSLGVFEAEEEDADEEPELGEGTPRRQRVFQYFGWHLRRQVAYDIWWLVSGIFLICIIERTKIMDDDNAPWFNLFRIRELNPSPNKLLL